MGVLKEKMDEQSIAILANEMETAWSLRDYISHPSIHFQRLMCLFSQRERLQLLNYVFEFYRTLDSSAYKLEDLVAFVLFHSNDPLPNEFLYRLYRDHNISLLQVSSPSKVDANKLSLPDATRVQKVCSGDDPYGLAVVVCSTIISIPKLADEELVHILKQCIEHPVDSPELAAAVSQCLQHNARLCEAYREETHALANEALMIQRKDIKNANLLIPFPHPHYFHSRAQILQDISKDPRLVWFGEINQQVRSRLDFQERFQFVESPYGLLVPASFRPKLITNFTTIVQRASKDKSTLQALSPRRFEEFISDLFRMLGYDVELTAATRDGGADILTPHRLIEI